MPDHSLPVEIRVFMNTSQVGDCIRFDGALDAYGYGRIKVKGRQRKAHQPVTATYGEHPVVPATGPSQFDRDSLGIGRSTRPDIPCPNCSRFANALADLIDLQRGRIEHLEREASAEHQRANELQTRLDNLDRRTA